MLMTLLTRSVEETFCEEVAIEDLTPTKVVKVNERRHLVERDEMDNQLENKASKAAERRMMETGLLEATVSHNE